MFKESLLAHVDELKSRLLKMFLVWFLCFIGLYPFMGKLFSFLIRPVGQVVFTAPSSAFLAEIKLSLFAAFFLSSPFIFYQVWQFISVGLKPHEHKYIRFFAPLSLICFLSGALFSYTIVIPFSMRFLLGFATEAVVPMITIENYFSFVITMTLAFGCLFEMPLVIMFLTAIGVATPEFLIQKRKHAILGLLVISALITPPDVLSLLMMTGPLVLLYEVGIYTSRWVDKGHFQ